MSEKATLLQSIPPVRKQSEGDGKVTLLSQLPETQSVNDSSGKQNSSLLGRQDSLVTGPGGQSGDVKTEVAVTEVAVTELAEPAPAITPFQYVTYASFVLNFLLAGFAAVVLFKKVSKVLDQRFSASVKGLAIGAVLVLLHGFFVTYLYASYLNDPSRSVPLFMTMALWVVLGPFVGYVTRNLLARKEMPNRNAALFDGGFYAFIFALSAFGINPAVSTNGALLLTITACFLMIMPIARSLTAYKVACARHHELKDTPCRILVYALLLIPALLPVLAFVHIFGMSELLTLFLINFITIDFIVVVTISMLMASSNFVSEDEPEEAVTEEAVTDESVSEESAQAVSSGAASAAGPAGPAGSSAAANPAPGKKQKIVTGNPEDPIIQFLNSEGGELDPDVADRHSAESKPSENPSRIQPPRKPGHPGHLGLAAPKKPSSAGSKAAPNAPQKVKAPAKPKKRL